MLRACTWSSARFCLRGNNAVDCPLKRSSEQRSRNRFDIPVAGRAAAHRSAVTALPSEETFGAVDSGEAEELGRRRRRHLKKKPGWYRKRQTGNLSKAQKQILRELWPNFGIELKYGVPVDLEGAFGQEINGLVLEVGFGMGEALTEMAAARPALSFVGVEWHRAGLASALKQIRDLELRNVRLVRGDALRLLADHMPNDSIDETCIFFPDPWPYDRDKERRVVRPQMLRLLRDRMKPGGLLHVATDVEDYARWTKEVMDDMAADGWVDCNSSETGYLITRPTWRPVTKYEIRGIEELGHDIFDMQFKLCDADMC
ncbi:hypothetical protein CYMTET_29307 [Cymbomonas tetramitiformis]|uniref:tRNA (guanine(46)-N(7))-methyltransferase n=1 Tax=Cymbomonas tetramitiformis TaxID=36881 RepID=A0AAE0KVB6_9CHLO|nr:hypothetical protein CYMTET_29307 [Cymbomonas tetramitiformis]